MNEFIPPPDSSQSAQEADRFLRSGIQEEERERAEPSSSQTNLAQSSTSLSNAGEEWELNEALRISAEAAPQNNLAEQTGNNSKENRINLIESMEAVLSGDAEWELNELNRVRTEEATVPRGQRQKRKNPSTFRRRMGNIGNGFVRRRKNFVEEHQIPIKYWDGLRETLNDVAAELKLDEKKRAESTDPVQEYMNKIEDPDNIKIYDAKKFGFRIMLNEKSNEEKSEIDRSKFEMLKFVYSRERELLNSGKAYVSWDPLDCELLKSIDKFIINHGGQSFRHGAFSVAIDFIEELPNLTWRSKEDQAHSILLRPVLIDGVAILDATEPTENLWTPFTVFNPQTPIYDASLNYPVKALFDVILDFLIRGHKVTAYLPMYYKKPIGNDNVARVDDVYVFQELVRLGFIEFLHVKNGRWFDILCSKVNHSGSVFVSSIGYRKRDAVIKYEKPADRIISPCFLNTEERLIIVEPSIRYREKGEKQFRSITAEKILHYSAADTDRDPQNPLQQQLYLEKQIELICRLCQLYPAKYLQKICIKQLLTLAIRSKSGLEMPSMDVATYLALNEQFSNNNFN